MLISTTGRPAALGKRLTLLASLLLLASAAQAQIGMLVAAAINAKQAADMQFVTKGKGTYQVADGTWQSNYLMLTQGGLQAGKGKKMSFVAKDVLRQVVISRDTFAVVAAVHYSPTGKDQQPAPVLDVVARRTWRRPQVEMLEYVSAYSSSMPVLRFPDGRAAALPNNVKSFRAAMLLLVGDHPKLAEQLQTTDLNTEHLRQILDAYLRWKPAGFDPTALLAAMPAANAAK